jgi:hypothetical protein
MPRTPVLSPAAAGPFSASPVAAQRKRPLLAVALLAALGSGGLSAADEAAREVQSLVQQWTGLARQQQQLQSAWQQDEPVLRQQLQLLQREAAELEAVVAASSEQQDEVEQRRLELLQEQTRYEQDQAALEVVLERAVLSLRGLHPRLPPPLHAAWQDELPRLDDARLSAGERLRIVLELLRQLDSFAQKITLHEGVLTVADGQDWLVQQVYLGPARGWYLSADGRYAGAGAATAEGWRWQPLEDAAQVAVLLDVLQRRRSPELVDMELQLAPAAGSAP